MPRTRNTTNCRPGSYFGVSPWQSKDDFGERTSSGGQLTSGVAGAGDRLTSSLRFRAATVTETKGSADCALFVDKNGSFVGMFADIEGHGGDPGLRRISGKFLEVAEGYREYLDCGRDSSWDVLLLCLPQSDGNGDGKTHMDTGRDDSHLYILAEAQGGDSLTISAPADLSGEEQAGVAGCVGSLTLATGFGLHFQCRRLINAEIDDVELVKRQLGEALSGTRLACSVVERLLPGKSFVNVGSLTISRNQ